MDDRLMICGRSAEIAAMVGRIMMWARRPWKIVSVLAVGEEEKVSIAFLRPWPGLYRVSADGTDRTEIGEVCRTLAEAVRGVFMETEEGHADDRAVVGIE